MPSCATPAGAENPEAARNRPATVTRLATLTRLVRQAEMLEARFILLRADFPKRSAEDVVEGLRSDVVEEMTTGADLGNLSKRFWV